MSLLVLKVGARLRAIFTMGRRQSPKALSDRTLQRPLPTIAEL